MNIDTGLAVVILAVLVFYLRLIVLQRERAKRITSSTQPTEKMTSKGKPSPSRSSARYTILSQNRIDLAISGAGVVAILVGILLNLKAIPILAVQPYWWLPTAVGIVAFSWAFKL